MPMSFIGRLGDMFQRAMGRQVTAGLTWKAELHSTHDGYRFVVADVPGLYMAEDFLSGPAAERAEEHGMLVRQIDALAAALVARCRARR